MSDGLFSRAWENWLSPEDSLYDELPPEQPVPGLIDEAN